MFPMNFGGMDLDALLRQMQGAGAAKGGTYPGDPAGGMKAPAGDAGGAKGPPPPTIAPQTQQAQGQPFAPGFVSTSPFDAMPRWVNSPEERALALASQANTQARHDTIGMANLNPSRAELAAFEGLAGQLGGQMRSAGHEAFQGREGVLNRENQQLVADKGVLGQMDVEKLRGANQLDVARQHGQDAVKAAELRAAADQGQSLNAATIGLLGQMATNPNADPKAMAAAFDYLKSMRGGGQPAAPGAAPAGAAAPAADPLQKMLEVNRGNQQLNQLGSEFGVVGPNGFQQAPEIGQAHGAKFLDRVASGQMSPEQVAKLAEDIKAGKMGDPQKVIGALAKSTAQGYFKVQPPTGPDGKPIDFTRAMLSTVPGGVSPKVPGSYQIPGLFELNAAPESFPSRMGNVATMAGPRAGGVPYNQIRLPNGQVVPISPSELNSAAGNALGPKVSPEVYQNRAAYGDMLLRALVGKPN